MDVSIVNNMRIINLLLKSVIYYKLLINYIFLVFRLMP